MLAAVVDYVVGRDYSGRGASVSPFSLWYRGSDSGLLSELAVKLCQLLSILVLSGALLFTAQLALLFILSLVPSSVAVRV